MSTNGGNARQIEAMSLVATLRTAAEVCRSIALRKAGEDPSEQEPAHPTRIRLQAARADLRAVVNRLRVSLAVPHPEETALVRAFEDRMLIARAARDLHLVHQRLLSLYPDVEEDMVERARRIQAEAARLAASDDQGFLPAVAVWCESTAAFLDELAAAVYTAN